MNGILQKRVLMPILIFAICMSMLGTSLFAQEETKEMLDPTIIPKYVNQLEKPPVYVPHINRDKDGKIVSYEYWVDINKFKQQMPPRVP